MEAKDPKATLAQPVRKVRKALKALKAPRVRKA
jgi:hypothetical protein